MTDPLSMSLMVSVVLLWLVVLVLVVAVLALARQIGVLHTRLAPAGALSTSAGPKVGQPVEPAAFDTIGGPALTVGGKRRHAQLILFVSPTCPICKSLVPVARSLARSERRRLDLAFASDGGELSDHQEYAAALNIEKYPYVVSMALGVQFAVGKLPFAVLVDADGILRAKGLVNSREHLESLVESMDSGFESIQDYIETHVHDGALQKEPT